MEKKEEVYITYPLEVNSKLWEEFKDLIPRSITINDKLIEIIKKFIDEKK